MVLFVKDMRYLDAQKKFEEAEQAILKNAKHAHGSEHVQVNSDASKTSLWRPPVKPLASKANL